MGGQWVPQVWTNSQAHAVFKGMPSCRSPTLTVRAQQGGGGWWGGGSPLRPPLVPACPHILSATCPLHLVVAPGLPRYPEGRHPAKPGEPGAPRGRPLQSSGKDQCPYRKTHLPCLDRTGTEVTGIADIRWTRPVLLLWEQQTRVCVRGVPTASARRPQRDERALKACAARLGSGGLPGTLWGFTAVHGAGCLLRRAPGLLNAQWPWL